MISISEIDEAIASEKNDTTGPFRSTGPFRYHYLVDECIEFLRFLEIPHSCNTISGLLKLTKFFLDNDKVKALNVKLNNKALW